VDPKFAGMRQVRGRYGYKGITLNHGALRLRPNVPAQPRRNSGVGYSRLVSPLLFRGRVEREFRPRATPDVGRPSYTRLGVHVPSKSR
ncbi:MAG: hypothetical protein ACREQV_20295, partial [Candidatus Binatia bacterium]